MDYETTIKQIEWIDAEISGVRDPGRAGPADLRDLCQAKLALVQCVAGQTATGYVEAGRAVGGCPCAGCDLWMDGFSSIDACQVDTLDEPDCDRYYHRWTEQANTTASKEASRVDIERNNARSHIITAACAMVEDYDSDGPGSLSPARLSITVLLKRTRDYLELMDAKGDLLSGKAGR